MIKRHLGLELRMWIMQVSLFSSVLIDRFHCIGPVESIGGINKDICGA